MQLTTFRWARWTRWLAVAALLVAAYAASGFWLVPFLIRHQLPKFAQSELERRASVGEVAFNPFTLRLSAADLRLAEADGAPLFAVGQLVVELRWRSIIRRAWTFAEIRVAAPSANLVITKDGQFNLAELLDTIERRPHEASSDTKLPRIVVERLALEQGKVEMHDRRAGYDNVVSPIDFTVANFSTLSDQDDSHTMTAESGGGGRLRWKGRMSVNPIHGSGELALENASLPPLAVYLKSYTHARLAAGQLSATLPYTFSYADGKFAATVAGAKLALSNLALAREGGTDSFATLTGLQATGIDADLVGRQVAVAQVHASGGKLNLRRDAQGELDLANLMVERAAPAAAPPVKGAVAANDWKLAVKDVLLDQVAVSAVDETASPPARLDIGKLRLQLQLAAGQAGPDLQVKLSDMALATSDLTLASGAQTPFKLAQLGFTDGTLDLAARRAAVGRLYAQGGQLQVTRDGKGAIDVLGVLPKAMASRRRAQAAAVARGAPWSAVASSVELTQFSADVQDQGSGVKVHVNDLSAKLTGASSDLKHPVKFDASLSLREGGQLSGQGSVVPDSGALQADVRVTKLALAPLQPMLGRFVKLKIAGGDVSAQGRLASGAGTPKSASLRYVGALNIAGLKLNEADGDVFAQWRNVSADTLTASIGPNRLDIPELRLVDGSAKLGIEDDRSFNAARLLVQPAGGTAKPGAKPAAAAGAVDDAFPVRIRRLRVQNAKLDFADLSLRPQFAAKIYDLNGVVNGLSSNRQARSQVELDGRVDEFGQARVRGELNPFAPRNNTDLNVVFKNVDMVATSPYAMKFAGYHIAEGKISLDLQYKVRNGQLEGANQIVIDRLRLGERVDSPDALKLPLELAIALLKDSDGRIDLGLPVSGDMNNPQFSYGALIWKAVSTVLTRIITAPFRAIGRLLGVSGEKLESVEFDGGSDKLQPPEREKLQQIAQLLAKRPQLKLTVPAQYSEAADGAALRTRAVRLEIARRAGVKLQPGEAPGPVDLGSRAVRSAIRDLYAARFGDAELDQQKKAAERPVPAPAVAASGDGARAAKPADGVPIWQRVGKMIEGEPQVADAGAFYNQLLHRLEQNQPLPEGELARLGQQRAEAVLAALKEAGVDPARAAAAPPEKAESAAGKPVALKLALGAK